MHKPDKAWECSRIQQSMRIALAHLGQARAVAEETFDKEHPISRTLKERHELVFQSLRFIEDQCLQIQD